MKQHNQTCFVYDHNNIASTFKRQSNNPGADSVGSSVVQRLRDLRGLVPQKCFCDEEQSARDRESRRVYALHALRNALPGLRAHGDLTLGVVDRWIDGLME
jgi:hypothetical protein